MNITKQRLQQLAGIIPLNEITIKPIKSKLDRIAGNSFEGTLDQCYELVSKARKADIDDEEIEDWLRNELGNADDEDIIDWMGYDDDHFDDDDDDDDDDDLNEITIKSNSLTVNWVKSNFEKIYKNIEEIDDQLHNNTTLTLDNVDEIDYSETLIDIEGYGLDDDDLSKIPKDFITIHIPSSNSYCDGIYISNYGEDIQELIGSGGYDWKSLPNSKYFYSYMWC